MKKLIVFMFFIVLSLLIVVTAGCASKFNTDDSPAWTTNPPATLTTFYAVGYGKLSNYQNSLVRAESTAKDRIAGWASTSVRGALTNYFQDSGESGSQTLEMMESISSQIVNVAINGATMEESWQDANGGVWVLYSYPKRNLKEAYRLKAEALERSSAAYEAKLLLEYLEQELADKN